MIRFGFAGFPGQIDHARTVEDFSSMVDHFRDGRASPPLALLSEIGGDILYAARGDAGAWSLKRNAALHRLLASLPYGAAFAGALPVNCLLLALALGRKDLHREFLRAGDLNLERAVKWLVLYGMDEHRLWRFLDARFVADLRRRRIPSAGGPLSPLDLILLDEREDLRGLESRPPLGLGPALDGWIERNGVQEYRLFWALDEAALARIASRPPDIAGGTFAAALAEAHASGRADILVATPEFVGPRLEAASRLSSSEREAMLTLPPEDEDDPASAPRAPAALSSALFQAFDFMPGDNGLKATRAGDLGQPGARGAPLLGPVTTFFFAAPRARRVILTVEASLADEAASLLVWIDGRPADLFPAKALASRAVKVHALRNALAAPLAVGLEVLGGRSSGARGRLASLGLLAHRIA